MTPKPLEIRGRQVNTSVCFQEGRVGQTRNKRDEQWDARCKELLEYRLEHGDCDVPNQRGKLGKWVSHQRTAYRAGLLEQDRIDRLNGIGFKWAITPWETRLNELVRYKAKHGDCKVPASQGQLGSWVLKQRQIYKKGKLPQDRIDRLSSIGFNWTLVERTVPWGTRFCELVQYKAKHGDCNVPRSSHRQLGKWVDTQRQQYKRGKLAQDRINRLSGIGFDWTPQRGGSRKRKSPSSIKQNRSLRRKKRVGAGSETMGEGRDVTSVSLSIPSSGSHQFPGTESDEEVEEIGALIYDQVMQQRHGPTISNNGVYQTLQDTTARQTARSTRNY